MADAIGPARRRLRQDVKELRGIKTVFGCGSLAIAVNLVVGLVVVLIVFMKLNWMPSPWFADSTVIGIAYGMWVRRICSSIIQLFQVVERLYENAEQSEIPNIDVASNRIRDQMKIFFTSMKIYLVLAIVIQWSQIAFMVLDMGRSTYLTIALAVLALAQVLIVEYRLVDVNRHMSSIVDD